MSQGQPQPGWYEDPAGSCGLRWWDGVAWTEHVAPAPEQPGEPQRHLQAVPVDAGAIVAAAIAAADAVFGPTEVDASDAAAGPEPSGVQLADDVHVRDKGAVFPGALRGPVIPVAERRVPRREELLGLVGLQLAGAVAGTMLSWWLAAQSLLGGRGTTAGIFAAVGVLVPVAVLVSVQVRARADFWIEWSLSRGFLPQMGRRAAAPAPSLEHSPLLGRTGERVIEFTADRELAGRPATVCSLLRMAPAGSGDDARVTPAGPWRSTAVLMPLPEATAVRWASASIRADHAADRPLVMRAMTGPLVPNAVPGSRVHLAVGAQQDPMPLQRFVDAPLAAWLAEHPVDVDIVDGLLVVTRDGGPETEAQLDDLCRDALALHERLVPAHELPAAEAPTTQAEPEPVVDRTRVGWTDAA